MGIQVSYNIKDLQEATNNRVVITEDKSDSYIHYTAYLDDIFMGFGIADEYCNDDMFWFDNKTINMEARDILDKYNVPYSRN